MPLKKKIGPNNVKSINFAVVFFIACFFSLTVIALAEEPVVKETFANQTQSQVQATNNTLELPAPEVPPVPEAKPESINAYDDGVVTLDFKDADIRNVLRIISFKGHVNIVATPEVAGLVSIRLVDVPWESALDIILRTYNFAYERKDNVIMVAPLEKLTAQKKQEVELAQVQPVSTEVFNLRFIDAQDAKKALESQLSARGKITILEMTGQAGWEFGGAELGKRARRTENAMGRSNVVIVSDIPPALERVRDIISKIDKKPVQVLIETKLLEVSRARLKDLGVDLGTGTTGAESTNITGQSVGKGRFLGTVGGHNLASLIKPSVFTPSSTGITGITPFNTGLDVVFQKLTGTEFEVILHALEEDVHTNTLSAPKILTLSNQEATILVGSKYPILASEASTQSQYTVSQTLSYYQDIGIQLNIVPQVSSDDYINIVIHPAVTSYTNTVGTNEYPIIDTRELETRILMKSGETIVIGGLLKDVKSKSYIGIPILSDIPLLGQLFKRKTTDSDKIDLLVFITAKIVNDADDFKDDVQRLSDQVSKIVQDKPKKEKKQKGLNP